MVEGMVIAFAKWICLTLRTFIFTTSTPFSRRCVRISFTKFDLVVIQSSNEKGIGCFLSHRLGLLYVSCWMDQACKFARYVAGCAITFNLSTTLVCSCEIHDAPRRPFFFFTSNSISAGIAGSMGFNRVDSLSFYPWLSLVSIVDNSMGKTCNFANRASGWGVEYFFFSCVL